MTMATVTPIQQDVRELYLRLKRHSANLANSEWLARMLSSHAAGNGAMPERLGLTAKQFLSLMRLHFPGLAPQEWDGGSPIDIERAEEMNELRQLFLAHTPRPSPEREWMADILAAGCMASDHLWQDLGLWQRQDLSAMIGYNFQTLAAKNDRDMKWKRFFYKQLCNQEGIYTCRAPSCEVCNDYVKCFGPEV